MVIALSGRADRTPIVRHLGRTAAEGLKLRPDRRSLVESNGYATMVSSGQGRDVSPSLLTCRSTPRRPHTPKPD